MRHIIIYKVLYACDAGSTLDAIDLMLVNTGIRYEVEQHCIINVPCDEQPVHWYSSITGE